MSLAILKTWGRAVRSLVSTGLKVAPRARPQVLIRLVHEHNDGFVCPAPWKYVYCFMADGKTVIGNLSYGVSPLNDRIYVSGINIEPDFQRRGYGTSLLLAVAAQHAVDGQHLPITPMAETWLGSGFWSTLRQRSPPGLAITRDLDVLEILAEPKRWEHLKPAPIAPWHEIHAIQDQNP